MKKKWFTLLEIIIAISVFSIWVLAVLNLIMHNLSALDKVQTKINASILANESIQIVYNLRDSNLSKWLPRDCVPEYDWEQDDKICEYSFSSWENDIYQIYMDKDGYYKFQKISLEDEREQNFENNRLDYLSGNTWDQNIFWHQYKEKDIADNQTNFARYVLFTGIVEWYNILAKDKMMKIQSHVLFVRWWYTGEIVLESIIWNFIK